MLWYAELLIEAALLLRLTIRRDGRPRFEALIAADLLTQLVQIFGVRMGWKGPAARVWYLGVAIQAPLMALSLLEACEFRHVYHRLILFWWLSLTFGCAWIRIYPYTGTALLSINICAFALWLWYSVRQSA